MTIIFIFSDKFLLVTTVAYWRPSSFAINNKLEGNKIVVSVAPIAKSLFTANFAFDLPLYLTELPVGMPDQFLRIDKLHNLK